MFEIFIVSSKYLNKLNKYFQENTDLMFGSDNRKFRGM